MTICACLHTHCAIKNCSDRSCAALWSNVCDSEVAKLYWITDATTCIKSKLLSWRYKSEWSSDSVSKILHTLHGMAWFENILHSTASNKPVRKLLGITYVWCEIHEYKYCHLEFTTDMTDHKSMTCNRLRTHVKFDDENILGNIKYHITTFIVTVIRCYNQQHWCATITPFSLWYATGEALKEIPTIFAHTQNLGPVAI